MHSKKSVMIPINLLVLDVVGTLMLGLGMANVFAGVDVLPQSLRFEAYGMTFVVGGVILMLPMIFHVIGKAREHKESRPRIP